MNVNEEGNSFDLVVYRSSGSDPGKERKRKEKKESSVIIHTGVSFDALCTVALASKSTLYRPRFVNHNLNVYRFGIMMYSYKKEIPSER